MSVSAKSSVIGPRLGEVPGGGWRSVSNAAVLVSAAGVPAAVPTGPFTRGAAMPSCAPAGGNGSSGGCASMNFCSHPAAASSGSTASNLHRFMAYPGLRLDGDEAAAVAR